MRTTTIIDHSKFIEISNYEKAIKGKSARNHMKMEMLGSIIDVIGDKWARMSKDTKSALEYICFLAIERGFTYAGSEHVSGRYDIDSSTVRRYLSQLDKEGVISRKWRSSVKHNGRGQAVIFFTAHPYYNKYWNSLFFLDDETQANAQADNGDNAYSHEVAEDFSDSTIDKTYISKDLSTRIQDGNKLSIDYVSSRVPKEFVDLASIVSTDVNTIEEFYKVSQQVTRHMVYYTDDEKLEVSLFSFKQLIRNIKLGKQKIGNLFGYYNKVIHGILDRRYYEEMQGFHSGTCA